MAFAFVDDSGSGGDSPYFVLAGYTARDAAWDLFYRQWQSVLELAPKLTYFKMTEADGLTGQFAGFTAAERDARLDRFIEVILDCDLWDAAVATPQKDYDAVLYPIFPKSRTSPYYFAFLGMVTALSGFYRWSGSQEKVDVVFDEQDGMRTKAARLYHRFKGWYPH